MKEISDKEHLEKHEYLTAAEELEFRNILEDLALELEARENETTKEESMLEKTERLKLLARKNLKNVESTKFSNKNGEILSQKETQVRLEKIYPVERTKRITLSKYGCAYEWELVKKVLGDFPENLGLTADEAWDKTIATLEIQEEKKRLRNHIYHSEKIQNSESKSVPDEEAAKKKGRINLKRRFGYIDKNGNKIDLLFEIKKASDVPSIKIIGLEGGNGNAKGVLENTYIYRNPARELDRRLKVHEERKRILTNQIKDYLSAIEYHEEEIEFIRNWQSEQEVKNSLIKSEKTSVWAGIITSVGSLLRSVAQRMIYFLNKI